MGNIMFEDLQIQLILVITIYDLLMINSLKSI